MTFNFKKMAGLFMGALAAFTISTSVSASKTKIADVSQYQGNINWSKASKVLKYAIIRVQHGDTGDADFRIDSKRNVNAAGAKKYGVPFGQYGYAEFSSVADAKKEARDFYKRSNAGARFYVLDNEHRKGKGSEQSYVNAWLSQMRKLTNKPLIYYSYDNYVAVHKINYSKFDGSWIANYSKKPTASADLWQYTSTGRVSGISGNVDLSKTLNSSVVNSWFKAGSADTAKPTYYTAVPASKKVTITRNIYEYQDVNFKSRITKLAAGKTLSVKAVTRSTGGAYRFQLTNGNYITANKAFVSN
ncbi:GH25 family lysozyme [Lentilactobacillus farraginis]|uniref:Lyzozyme M1 n=1 Tax=Lentilactobacillus farraginis DSM 18382 = JCM 14108 TaxID=1423743 RepID=X0PJ30_9LACO|nr:GH25 family lysozyme [Lentilactobacillus farraginis]KRM10845.1 lyzozyme M1 (1,4-beta-N-acetylmuramidase) [Lentilactobacillus farraginis DSM 18382 = JCM 14108]GAF37202.1 lyzozyme M1 [Lentilactobacillus farraginis DSM 18382 = JCM 14108]